MLLLDKISESLVQLKGLEAAEPRRLAWSDDDNVNLQIDFVAVDSLSSAMRELRFTVGSLRDASRDVLQGWSNNLCQRITYLLEHVGPLEIDPLSMSILIRSTPPDRNGGTVAFYEILIERSGCMTLRRFSRTRGEADRQPLDIRLTHEVLRKLVQDLVDSVPATSVRPAALKSP